MPADLVDVLLDTHTLLWWRADGGRLSATARTAIEQAGHVLVSPISFWETAMLVAKTRVVLDRPTAVWARDVVAADGVETAALTVSAAITAAELGNFHGDPADRFLFATAITLRVPLISKDRKLHDYAELNPGTTVVW